MPKNCKHQIDWQRISITDDGEKYVDIVCKKCGLGGCLGSLVKLAENTTWEENHPRRLASYSAYQATSVHSAHQVTSIGLTRLGVFRAEENNLKKIAAAFERNFPHVPMSLRYYARRVKCRGKWGDVVPTALG